MTGRGARAPKGSGRTVSGIHGVRLGLGRLGRRARLALPGALALALAMSTGCGAAGPSKRVAMGEMGVAPASVPDAEFAKSVHELLRNGEPSPERQAVLVGVVRRQFAHAAARFAAGHPDRGTESVLGAFALVRPGEGQRSMIDAAGERALAGALERVGARGDEGRSAAFLDMRAAVLPPASPLRRQVEAHQKALAAWKQATRGRSPVQDAGANMRAAVSRALVDPAFEAQEAAVSAVAAWIDRAIEVDLTYQRRGVAPDRNEGFETARALDLGGPMMALIFLRHGDAEGALTAIDKTSASRVVRPALYERLRIAASKKSAAAFRALAATYAQQSFSGDGSEGFRLEPDLVEAAVFGTVLEAYRLEPTHPDTGRLLARLLVRAGMSAAAPLVLADSTNAQSSPDALASAIELVADALVFDARHDDADAARRTFAAAAPLFRLAEGKRLPEGAPEPSDVRSLMARIELDAGNLAGAKPLLAAASREEPTLENLVTLARVSRQMGALDEAAGLVRQALAAPDARQHPIEAAEARVLAFEIQRDRGAAAAAKRELDAALEVALELRQKAKAASERARVERLLGRVLDAYGDGKGAARAYDRAIRAAKDHRPALGPTVLDVIARALVRRDVDAARSALFHGIQEEIPEDDLIYGALWVRILEREAGVTTDGTADRALDALVPRDSWTGRLAAWAKGKLGHADLVRAAKTPAQRVEAAFYVAMAKRAAGDASASEALGAVAKSALISLFEVQIARDLLAPKLAPTLPANARLP